jgi:hypothetical protein
MKNRYALFFNNDHSFGPFEMLCRGSLETTKDAEDLQKQYKFLSKNVGSEFALVELDGTVVAIKFILKMVHIHGNMLSVEVVEKLEILEQQRAFYSRSLK